MNALRQEKLAHAESIKVLRADILALERERNTLHADLIAMMDQRNAAIALLRELEWLAGYDTCPCCARYKQFGHNEVCRLAALITEAE